MEAACLFSLSLFFTLFFSLCLLKSSIIIKNINILLLLLLFVLLLIRIVFMARIHRMYSYIVNMHCIVTAQCESRRAADEREEQSAHISIFTLKHCNVINENVQFHFSKEDSQLKNIYEILNVFFHV